MQISQIVLGFGGFYLDIPDTLSDLNKDQLLKLQLLKLREYIGDEKFKHETGSKCEHVFTLEEARTSKDLHGRMALIRKLFQ